MPILNYIHMVTTMTRKVTLLLTFVMAFHNLTTTSSNKQASALVCYTNIGSVNEIHLL
jgi:hypothetical protein